MALRCMGVSARCVTRYTLQGGATDDGSAAGGGRGPQIGPDWSKGRSGDKWI